MAAYVLLPGAWHGGWVWHKVAPLLQAAGHTVYTPSLTGLAERSHLLSPEIALETHARDIEQFLFYENLTEVILVGHSYGGVVLSLVADRAPERLARLVYLDASLLRDGESVDGTRAPGAPSLLTRREGLTVPPPPGFYERLGPGCGMNAEEIRWCAARLTPHPARTLEEPLRLTNPDAASAVPGTFLLCTKREIPMTRFAERAKVAQMQCRTLDAPHMLQLSHPRETADLLLGVA